ncbi:MAG: transposase [Lentisphaeria bacterium]|jgi:transposase
MKQILVKDTTILTVVLNGINGEVLHIAEGKRKTNLESFFQKLTPEKKASIQAVGIDRSGAYRAVIKEQIPDASIVFDKFHIVSNYNDVIDEIRREEWRQAEGKEGKGREGKGGRQKIH